jgi:hypothetical protein
MAAGAAAAPASCLAVPVRVLLLLRVIWLLARL